MTLDAFRFNRDTVDLLLKLSHSNSFDADVLLLRVEEMLYSFDIPLL